MKMTAKYDNKGCIHEHYSNNLKRLFKHGRKTAGSSELFPPLLAPCPKGSLHLLDESICLSNLLLILPKATSEFGLRSSVCFLHTKPQCLLCNCCCWTKYLNIFFC